MPTETLTTHPDPALFLDFLDPNLSLLDLADRHQLSLDDLLDWSEHPETHQRLTRLHTLITLRNSYLAAEKLPIALTSLTAVATQTAPADADPALAQRTTESARRAATQLARLASLAPARARPRPAPEMSVPAIVDPNPGVDLPVLDRTDAPSSDAIKPAPDPEVEAQDPAPIPQATIPESTSISAPDPTDEPIDSDSFERAAPSPLSAPLHLAWLASHLDPSLHTQTAASLPSRAVAHPWPDP